MSIHAANKQVRDARTDLNRAHSALSNALTVEEERKRVAESAAAAELEASVDDALKLSAVRRDADVIQAAASRAVAAARRVHEAAESNLKAALDTQRRASYAVMAAKVRAYFSELERLNARRRELRDILLGAYLVDCDDHRYEPILTDDEWQQVNTPAGEYTAEQMDIGMPMIAVSLYRSDALGDPNPARNRCNAAAAGWRGFLVEQQTDPPAAQDAAAA